MKAKDKEQETLQKLKHEHNKTADWIEFFNEKLDMVDHKVERMEESLKKIEENQTLIAQHVLHIHNKIK